MKTNVIILAALISVTTLFSCKKNDDAVQTPTTVNKVKTYSEEATGPGGFHSVDTFSLTYDASNRLLSNISIVDPGNKFVYTYNGNTSYTTEQWENNILSIRNVAYINSGNLLVDSTFEINNSSPADSSTEKFIYNSSNQLTEERYYSYSAVTGSEFTGKEVYTYDANGNQITDVETNELGVVQNSTTTTYGTATATIFGGMIYYPQPSKYLPVTEVTTNSGPTDTTTITYTFDSDGRVSSITRSSAPSGFVSVQKFTYY